MAFSSVQFLFVFLPLALAVYYLFPRVLRTWVLAAFSLLFFAWGGLRHTALLVVFAAFQWLAGLILARPRGRALLPVFVCADLAVLAGYKYIGWLAESVNTLVPGLLPILRPALPLGLSFYVFTALAYLTDVARGRTRPAADPVKLFLLLAFFGHGPSGPIVRAEHQLPQLAALPAFESERFCYGIKRFVLGLAKKALIADQLALVYTRATSVPAADLPAPLLVLGYTAFMMQLYFDFSGYSDMAVGVGALFGLELPENFNYPYLAATVGEYWRRWHMTLNAWFLDYVYIPLGGSRRGLKRTCLHLLLVFLLTGVWHGAAWNFVAFGLYHGLLLCLERLFWKDALQRMPRLFRHLYTLAALWVGLVLFGAPGLREALHALLGILRWQDGAEGLTLAALADTKLLLILAASVLLCGPLQALLPRLRQALQRQAAPRIPGMVFLFVLLFFSIMRVTAGNYNAFIYAQF
ncbi:MAG: MBOAT family O-acyltransferase [Gemmiger sp.]